MQWWGIACKTFGRTIGWVVKAMDSLAQDHRFEPCSVDKFCTAMFSNALGHKWEPGNTQSMQREWLYIVYPLCHLACVRVAWSVEKLSRCWCVQVSMNNMLSALSSFKEELTYYRKIVFLLSENKNCSRIFSERPAAIFRGMCCVD